MRPPGLPVLAQVDPYTAILETLIVVSSDLSHYHPYPVGQRLDEATAQAIEALDGTGLGPQAACGCLPIAGLLLEAKRRALAHHVVVRLVPLDGWP